MRVLGIFGPFLAFTVLIALSYCSLSWHESSVFVPSGVYSNGIVRPALSNRLGKVGKLE